VEAMEGTKMEGDASETDTESRGTLREIVSPDWVHSSNLSVSLLTLPYGAVLVEKKSPGVEVYYVVKGEGVCNKGDESSTIRAGMAVLVDPGRYVQVAGLA